VSTTLTDALKQLDLQPGETRLISVNGYQVEVRRLPAEPSDYADQVMLDPWFTIPDPPAVGTVIAQRGTVPLPDPPVVPPDDEVIE
jgi:hypothetical protein